MAKADIAIKVFPDTHDRLARLRDQMEAERPQREGGPRPKATFDEAVVYLLDFRDEMLRVPGATEAGR